MSLLKIDRDRRMRQSLRFPRLTYPASVQSARRPEMNDAPHAIVEIDGYAMGLGFIHKSLFQRVSVDLTTGEASEAVWGSIRSQCSK